MKGLVVAIFLFFVKIDTCSSQSFNSLPPGFNFGVISLYFDSLSNVLYAGGNFWEYSNGINVNYIAQWNGTQWDSLGAGVFGNVYSIVKFDGEIYAGGNFQMAGTVNAFGLAKWDGFDWLVAGGNASLPQWSVIWDLNVMNNELYVFGNYDSINNLPANGMAKFDGQNWSIFPNIDPIGSFHASELYNGELYIGGNFDGGTGLQDIAKFDGTNWVTVGGGLSGPMSDITDMIIFQNKLFVVGNLLVGQGDPGNGIAMWDGNNWSQAGSGLMPSTVSALHEFQGELYAGGAILNAGGVSVTYIAKWDGTSWHSLGANFNNKAGCFASYNNDLYIGGGFRTINGDTMNYITKYTLPVGINDIEAHENAKLLISPNPTSNSIEINLAHGSIDEIEIFDLSGKLVLEQQGDESLSCQLDVSLLANGIYVIKVFSEYGIYSEKLIIQKME